MGGSELLPGLDTFRLHPCARRQFDGMLGKGQTTDYFRWRVTHNTVTVIYSLG